MFKRYAIFYTPPPGDWADFCAAWLGWSSAMGQTIPHPEVHGLDVATLTETPRKYGIHATMKAPFYLAEDQSFEALENGVGAFCQTVAPVTLDGLELSRPKSFIALTPFGEVEMLQMLETRIVQDLEPFRAPLSDHDLTRRRAAGLTPKQDQYLVKWGYPFVMDEFRFHITLTGRLDDGLADTVKTVLQPHIAPLLPKPFVIDHLTLMGEDETGLFHHIHRYPLTG
jgi:putative phosphonate metabolism protein